MSQTQTRTARGWTEADVPDLSGRLAVVTGANSGLGFETARVLAGAGARVVMACRDAGRGARAQEAIRAGAPRGEAVVMPLDLSSLASVRDFAKAFGDRFDRLDLLCNNAGVMALPLRRTADGFEMQFGTNHLGHFALTGLLLEPLQAADAARVVTVSSTAHRIGRIRFDDLQWTRGYGKWPAYGQSKLANLLFAYELQRRFERAGWPVQSLAAHPGYASTELQATGPRMEGNAFMVRFMGWANGIFSQSAAMGALPSLYAACAPEARGGEYYGPGRLFEMMGPPARVGSSRRSRDEDAARRLWEVSAELTGVDYAALD
jgi:NAD(P)-dependent dehydrogenase (short-subunit alcohol dehydrogenase family)